MAFITNHTFNRIVNNIDLDSVGNPKKSDLDNIDLWMLSFNEKKRLFLIKKFLENNHIDIQSFFLKIKKPVDDLTKVFPETLPSYHINANCSAMLNKYHNYDVPDEIRERGALDVNKYRSWFNLKINLLFEKKYEDFFRSMIDEFSLKKKFVFSTMSAKNSGINESNKKDLEEAWQDILCLIQEAEIFKYSNPDRTLSINKFGNKTHIIKRNPSDFLIKDSELNLLSHWHDIKNNIKKAVFKYFLIKSDFKFDLREDFLEYVGIKRCAVCYSGYKLKEDNAIEEMKFEIDPSSSNVIIHMRTEF